MHTPVNNPDVNIKEIRKKLKLTQQEFADRLGITRELLGQIERGKKAISKATNILLKNFLKENNVPQDTLNIPSNPTIEKLIGMLEKLVNTNAEVVGTNTELVSICKTVTANAGQGISKDVESRLDVLQEAIVEVGTGKRYHSKEEGHAKLSRRASQRSAVVGQ